MLIFGPKTPDLPHFEHKIFFSKKKSLRHFFVFIEASLREKKSEKSNDLSKEKGLADIRMYGQTDGRTDGAEFIGPLDKPGF